VLLSTTPLVALDESRFYVGCSRLPAITPGLQNITKWTNILPMLPHYGEEIHDALKQAFGMRGLDGADVHTLGRTNPDRAQSLDLVYQS
jgi:hypothetical protein